MARITTIDKDLGAKELMKKLRDIKERRPYVKAGVLESAGDHGDSGLTVAQVATFNEFGVDSTDLEDPKRHRITPERSFIRTTMFESEERLLELTAKLKDRVLFEGLRVKQALGFIGATLRGLIQKKISEGDDSWPPNAPATIEAKGSSRPLIDSSQMRQAVNYEVVEDGDR